MIKKVITILFAVTFLAVTITGCTNTKNNTDNKTPETENNVENNTGTEEDPNVQTNGNNNKNLITEDRAKEIALEHAKLKEEDVTFLTAKLEMDDGLQVYEVDFYTADREYDYEINAVSGEVISHNYEAKGNSENGNTGGSNNTNGSIISEKDAKQAALDKVKGATDKDIEIWLDTDDGVQRYEGKILYDNKKYEFEIDPVTGTVIEWEEESVK